MNTLGLINLGRLVEPWYRTGPFLAACLAIGGLGNLVGGALRQGVALARPWLASMASAGHWPGSVERLLRGDQAPPVSIHTGGGSTILLGLLALGAVVGWRSKTRIGAHLRKQMVLLLGLTAVLGVAMSALVDNYGHLGGAIVGALIGFVDRPLVRASGSPAFRAACWGVVVIVSTACVGVAVRDDRSEAGYRHQLAEVVVRGRVVEATRSALARLHTLYASIALATPRGELDALAVNELLSRGPRVAPPLKADPEQPARDAADLARLLDQMDQAPADLWGGEVAADLARVRSLGREALESPPRFEQVYDFALAWLGAEKAVAADYATLTARLVELEATRRIGR